MVAKKQKIKMVIFDMDGIIVNSKSIYLQAFKNSLGALGHMIDFRRIGAALLTPTLSVTAKTLLPSQLKSDSMIRKILGTVNNMICERGNIEKIRACPNAVPVLKSLKKKVKLCLVTNSYQEFVNRSLEILGVRDVFEEVITASDNFPSKADACKHIIDKFKLNPEEVAYVGDWMTDVWTAKEVGCVSVIVYNECSWGYRNKKVIVDSKPDYLFNNLKELSKIIR